MRSAAWVPVQYSTVLQTPSTACADLVPSYSDVMDNYTCIYVYVYIFTYKLFCELDVQFKMYVNEDSLLEEV